MTAATRDTATTAKPGRWAILSMIFTGMMINYLDRAALSVAMPFIARDFELDTIATGYVLSAFFIGYALFNVLGGYFADRYGARSVFSWSMLLWSAFCSLTAVTSGFWSLAIVRTLFGMGEGPISTTANNSISEWFPAERRALAIGISQAGSPLGGALAGPVVGLLALTVGWRLAFVLIGAVGLFWIAGWVLLNRRLEGRPVARAAEQRPQPFLGQFAAVVRTRGVVPLALSLFCYNYLLFFFLTWFPTYLVEARGLSIASMAFVSMLPWLTGAAGYVLGGAFTDALVARTGRPVASRRRILMACIFVAAVAIGTTNLVETRSAAVALMTVAVASLMLAGPSYWALIQDFSPPSQIGSAGGLMHGTGNLAGILAPVVTGYAVALAGSWTGAFLIAGGLGLLGVLLIAFGIRGEKHPGPPAAKQREAACIS